MKQLNKVLFMVFLVVGILAACDTGKAAPPPPPSVEAPINEKYFCTFPESDNGKSWKSGTQVCYDTAVYTLAVKVLGDISNNQTVQGYSSGSMYGGYGYSSSRMWTEGKGVLPVQIISMNPVADASWGEWLDTSKPYILKTSDLGFMAVPSGGTVTVICNHDVEALSPVFTGQTFTQDRLSHELDNCRLKTKNFDPAR